MSVLLHLPLTDDERTKALEQLKPNHTPLWEYWAEFVEDFTDLGGSERTVSGVRSFLTRIIREAGIVSIEDCNNPRIVKRALHDLKERYGFKGVTFNKYRGNLITYFRWLEDMEYIEKSRIQKVRKFSVKSVEIKPLTNAQIHEILDVIHKTSKNSFVAKRNTLLFDLFRNTGARRTELLALTPKDIFFDEKNDVWTVRLHRAKQKGSIDELNLPEYVGRAYIEYMEIRNKTRKDEKLLFCSQCKKDVGLTAKGVTYMFKEIQKHVSFKVTSKMFRAYIATDLKEQGVDIKDISMFLGHRRVSTTEKYIKKTGKVHSKCSQVIASRQKASNPILPTKKLTKEQLGVSKIVEAKRSISISQFQNEKDCKNRKSYRIS